MNKFILTSIFAVAAMSGMAQVSAQSVTVTRTTDSFAVLMLKDGYGSSYGAVSYRLATLPVLGNRLTVQGIGAFDNGTGKSVYAGTGLAYNLVDTHGWRVQLVGGFKGLDINNLKFATGKGSFVFGLGLTVPFRT